MPSFPQSIRRMKVGYVWELNKRWALKHRVPHFCLCVITTRHKTPTVERVVHQFFNLVDADTSGFLSEKELTYFLMQFDKPDPQPDGRQFKDGKISLKEFREGMAAKFKVRIPGRQDSVRRRRMFLLL